MAETGYRPTNPDPTLCMTANVIVSMARTDKSMHSRLLSV